MRQLPPAEAGSLSLALRDESRIRDVRRVDSRPATNIDRRDVVRESSVSAGRTGELTLRGTVALINTAALGAGPGGIARVYRNDRNARQLRLVLDKAAQLVERPAMPCRPLVASNSYPLADVRQIFQRNPAPGAFRLGDDALTDRVVGVRGKAALFTGESLEAATGRLRAFLLQFLAKSAMAVTNVFDVRSRVRFAVRVNRDVRHAKVYAKKLAHVRRLRRFNLAGREQVELAAHKAQIRLAALRLEQLPVPLATNEGDTDTTGDGPNGDGVLCNEPPQNPAIVGNRTVRPEGPLGLAVQLVGVNHLADAADHQLRGEAERLFRVVVGEPVEGDTAKDALRPRYITNRVTRGIGRFERLKQRRVLFGSRLQFDLGCELQHVESIAQKRDRSNAFALLSRRAPFLPRLKAGVSWSDFL